MSEITLMTGRRALAVVELLGHHSRGCSFSEIGVALSLAPASLARMLKMLVEEGWIRHDTTAARYEVGFRALRMGRAMQGFGSHSALLEGLVNGLAQDLGHSTCIASHRDDSFVLTTKCEKPDSYHFIDLFTPNTDWVDNAMGPVLLAHQPAKIAEAILQRGIGRGLTDEDRALFEQVLNDGYLVRREGFVTRFVAPIPEGRDGAVRNVLSVAVISADVQDRDNILNLVRGAAAEASRRLSVLERTPMQAYA